MKFLHLGSLLLLTSLLGAADPDPRVRWLAGNATKLTSIDPADTDFSDLETLKAMIGDSRIVALGEQTHGDGATFRAKCRLIRFLHQEMGFSVISFESGIFDCHKSDQAFREGRNALEAARLGVWGIWTMSGQVQPLFEYIAEQARGETPLAVSGFDCRFSARGSQEHLRSDLRDFLRSNLLYKEKEWKPLDEAMAWLLDSEKELPAKAMKAHIRTVEAYLKKLKRWAKSLEDDAPERFWIQVLESSHGLAEWRLEEKKTSGPASNNLRDEQMAENLIWLAEKKYPGEKIILWAASFHLMRNAPRVKSINSPTNYARTVPMGHLVHEHFEDDYFSVAFSAYEGHGGRPFGTARRFDIGQAPKDSLEDLLVRAGFENAYLSFRQPGKGGKWLTKRQVSRPLGNAPQSAPWPRIFDALVFTRTMTPSTPPGEAPPAEEGGGADDLMAEVEKKWAEVQAGLRRQPPAPFVDKWDFSSAYEAWKAGGDRDAAALRRELKRLEEWRKGHRRESAALWRIQRLIAWVHFDLGDQKQALRQMERAIVSYQPVFEYDNPTSQSKFQHLVNDRCLLVWSLQGRERAMASAIQVLLKDVRLRYFYLGPWEERFEKEGGGPSAFRAFQTQIREAYGQRAKRFPQYAEEARRFAAQLK